MSTVSADTEQMRLQLESDIVIELIELHQSLEYEGLLEGLPTRERNESAIRALVGELGVGTLVIQPTQEPIDFAGLYPFGEPAKLPPIRCIGRFTSRDHLDPDADYSELTVLWWQQEFGLPSDEAVLLPLRRMDWARYAIDHTY